MRPTKRVFLGRRLEFGFADSTGLLAMTVMTQQALVFENVFLLRMVLLFSHP